VQVPASQLHLPIALSPTPAAAEFSVMKDSVPPAAPGTPVMDDFVPPAAEAMSAGVRQASAIVKGMMDKDIIRRIVRAHINEIRYCYNQGLAKDPALEGRVSIQFTIGATGKVAGAVVEESTLSDPKVGECMVKAVKRWVFPKPDGGGNVVVTYPFVLEPG